MPKPPMYYYCPEHYPEHYPEYVEGEQKP